MRRSVLRVPKEAEMSILASRRGIALLLVGVVVGLVAHALILWFEPVAHARAQMGTEVEVVPLSGAIPGEHGGTAIIYAKVVEDGDIEIGYFEVGGSTQVGDMAVFHSTSKQTWDQGAYAP